MLRVLSIIRYSRVRTEIIVIPFLHNTKWSAFFLQLVVPIQKPNLVTANVIVPQREGKEILVGFYNPNVLDKC